MRCHYEVLGVEREASAAEVKAAYRRGALQWHPDKNPDRLQEAKENFQLLQNAYEVLSDPQERAWYDNHREQLLRGARSSYNDSSLDVFPYFSPSCYKGFGDDEQGFYAVYAEVFSKLASEETDFLDDPEDVAKIPKFGTSTTAYEQVHEFYAFWMSFSTNKSYVWLDQYDIQQGDNRRVIKLMEKENNKIRQKARKERNEEVRRLVSYVRRKDRRVIEHTKLLQEKAEENKKKAELLRRERIIQRQKEIEEAKKKQGESSFLQTEDYQKKLSEIENLLQEEFGISSDDDTISEGGMESSNEDSSKSEEVSESKPTPKKQKPLRNLYCTACNKLFKNVKSFENHENSKKHKENVSNMTLDEDIEISDNNEDSVSSLGGVVNGGAGLVAGGGRSGEEQRGEEAVEEEKETPSDNGEKETLSESEHLEVLTKSQKKKKNKKKFLPQPESEGNESHDEMSFNEIEGPSRSRRSKKFTMLKNQIQAKKESAKEYQSHTSTENIDESPLEAPSIDIKPPTKRVNKPKKIDKKTDQLVYTEEINLNCAVCKTEFPSKNKLFDHLKKTGHSVALPQCVGSQKKGKRGNR